MTMQTPDFSTRHETLASSEVSDPITQLLRGHARELITAALEAEVQLVFNQLRLDGRDVVRNSYLPGRLGTTVVGDVAVEVPRIRSRDGESVNFASSMIPRYLRRSESVSAWAAYAYLKGISERHVSCVLEVVLGEGAKKLTPVVLSELKKPWTREFNEQAFRSKWVSPPDSDKVAKRGTMNLVILNSASRVRSGKFGHAVGLALAGVESRNASTAQLRLSHSGKQVGPQWSDSEPTYRKTMIDGPDARKSLGAFFTPEPIAHFLARWAISNRSDAKVLDPTCGDGVFLWAAAEELSRLGSVEADFDSQVYGVDIHAPSLTSAMDDLRRTIERIGVL